VASVRVGNYQYNPTDRILDDELWVLRAFFDPAPG